MCMESKQNNNESPQKTSHNNAIMLFKQLNTLATKKLSYHTLSHTYLIAYVVHTPTLLNTYTLVHDATWPTEQI